MKHAPHKSTLKRRALSALAGLLAAGLLLGSGGGVAGAAGGSLVLGPNPTELLTGAGYAGNMTMDGASGAVTNRAVTVNGDPAANAFTDLIITGSGIGANAISVTISTSVHPLSFSGNATIYGKGATDGPSASVIVTSGASMAFDGAVTLDGQFFSQPDGSIRPGGLGILQVDSGAQVTATGGFLIKNGVIALKGGELVGNVVMGGSPHGGLFLVQDSSSKVTGSVTIGNGGQAGALILREDIAGAPFHSFEITGNLVLNNVRDFEGGFFNNPDKTVVVGTGTTLTVGGHTEVNNDSILELRGGTLATPQVWVQDKGKLISTDNGAKVDGTVFVGYAGVSGNDRGGGTLDVVKNLEITQGLDLGQGAIANIASGATLSVGTSGSPNVNVGIYKATMNIASGGTLQTTANPQSPLLLSGVYLEDGGVLNAGPGAAAANITGNLTVKNGGAVNIGTSQAAGKLAVTGSVDFQAASRLSLYAAPEALTAGGGITIADGSKLLITGGAAGTYNDMFAITGSLDNAGGAAWTGANLQTVSPLLIASAVWNSSNQYLLTVSYTPNASSAFPKLDNGLGGLIGNMLAAEGLNTDSPNTGVRFISRAFHNNYIGANNPQQAAATVEGASELAQIAAVPGMTLAAANAGADAVVGRTAFHHPQFGGGQAVAMHQDTDGTVITGMSAGNTYTRNGLGLWLMPLYQNDHVWGMKAGNFKTGYNSALGGIALGADYTFQEMFRIGASFNVGGGYAKSSGDFNTSENNATFWGVNLYGGWTANNFGIGVEGGYTGTYNALRQDVPAVMGMPELKGDVNSDAWHAGLRAEYCFATPVLDIIPHAGARWTGVHTDSYKVKSGGGTVFKVDDSYQSIWTFPVGVSFAKSFIGASGWSFRPQVDAGVIPAAGDVKSKSRVQIPGIAGNTDLKVQQTDYVTFDGTAGFEVSNGQGFSVGINYNLQLSEHRTGHGAFGTLRYEF